jgi:hypothetical protein
MRILLILLLAQTKVHEHQLLKLSYHQTRMLVVANKTKPRVQIIPITLQVCAHPLSLTTCTPSGQIIESEIMTWIEPYEQDTIRGTHRQSFPDHTSGIQQLSSIQLASEGDTKHVEWLCKNCAGACDKSRLPTCIGPCDSCGMVTETWMVTYD